MHATAVTVFEGRSRGLPALLFAVSKALAGASARTGLPVAAQLPTALTLIPSLGSLRYPEQHNHDYCRSKVDPDRLSAPKKELFGC